MLYFPSPITHRVFRWSILVLALLASMGCLWFNSSPPAAPPPAVSTVVESPPRQVIPDLTYLSQEISLQETLDRLGFTVNVPHSYHSSTIASWGGYRTSTRSDAVPAERFEASGQVYFQQISLQSYLGPRSTLGAIGTTGDRVPLLKPTNRSGLWIGGGPETLVNLAGPLRFYLDHPNPSPFGPLAQKPLFSTPQDNPGRGAQLLALQARTGGTWVDEGGNQGHWEGGVPSGDLVLCWEDLPGGDHDYQDMVILASGIIQM